MTVFESVENRSNTGKSVVLGQDDYEAFLSQISQTVDQAGLSEKNAKKIAFRKQWFSDVPAKYRDYTFESLPEVYQQNFEVALKRSDLDRERAYQQAFKGGFYVRTEDLGTDMRIVYAILSDFASQGFFRYQDVMFFTEDEILTYTTSGFEGNKEFLRKMSSPHKAVVITDLGSNGGEYSAGENLLFSRIITDVFERGVFLIVQVAKDGRNWSKQFSNTTREKMNKIFEGRQFLKVS